MKEKMEDRTAKQSITAQRECNSGELIGPLCKNEVGWGIGLLFLENISTQNGFFCKGGCGGAKNGPNRAPQENIQLFCNSVAQCVVTYATVW